MSNINREELLAELYKRNLINSEISEIVNGMKEAGWYPNTVPAGDGKENFFGLSTPESEWNILSWCYYQKPEPVYWMPLPEVPKDGGTE